MKLQSIHSEEHARSFLGQVNALAEHRDVNVDGRNIRSRWFGIGRPLVLLNGGHGSWMHWSRNLETLAGRSGGRAVIIPDTGHWVPYEQPEVVNQLLHDCLTEKLDGDPQ